ncbi:serine/threonine protein kinase, partial [bacterium]|nr:serine/threonine protein kinase [bacterium]
MSCPDLEALERWAADPHAAPGIEAHLASCDACRVRLEEVSANLDLEQRARALRGDGGGDAGEVPVVDVPPDRIGPFRIVRELGRGGMGVVYLAQQERPRRRVALKVVSSASPEILRRFEREADLLARLQHPHIARVYESGGAGGRPYLAMEYVDGVPLEAWTAKASLGAKLELLAEVADAVHHAHRQGVLHRDLKPGNILVETTADGAAHPKVLDFGVARALGGEARTMTMRTEPGRLLGTVPFMSPEQVEGDSSRLDARSDVYSLGILAYWLLAGDLPYPLRDRSVPEMARIIRDEEPHPLATRDGRYRGDLDTIVAKALEKDPDRRYASAAKLAEDVRAHLAHRPIVARAPSAGYQLRKFARRNRVLVASAVV